MFRKARNSQNQNRDLFTKINYDLVLTCKDFNTTYLIILLLMATAEKCQVQPSCPFLILIINDFSLGESPVEGTQGSPSFPSAPLLLMNKPFSRDRLLERSSWLPEGRRVQSWRPPGLTKTTARCQPPLRFGLDRLVRFCQNEHLGFQVNCEFNLPNDVCPLHRKRGAPLWTHTRNGRVF